MNIYILTNKNGNLPFLTYDECSKEAYEHEHNCDEIHIHEVSLTDDFICKAFVLTQFRNRYPIIDDVQDDEIMRIIENYDEEFSSIRKAFENGLSSETIVADIVNCSLYSMAVDNINYGSHDRYDIIEFFESYDFGCVPRHLGEDASSHWMRVMIKLANGDEYVVRQVEEAVRKSIPNALKSPT